MQQAFGEGCDNWPLSNPNVGGQLVCGQLRWFAFEGSMAEMNQQFKQIIKSINQLNGRLDRLFKQIDKYYCKHMNFEKALNEKFNK